jgi:glycosyltransferase involved in cell wall biosynthesis
VDGVEEILVGINPDGSTYDFLLEPYLNNSRVKFFCHKEDLGLYGNFRFLLHQSRNQYFSWLCTDDQLSPSILELLNQAQKNSSNLVIPTWIWAEYYPDTLSFSMDDAKPGNYPNISSSDSTLKSIIYCEPSWIFGVWRTEYLQSIFPDASFDWLDTYLLQKVLLTGRVECIPVPDPMVIGTWHWRNKIPSSDNRRFHNPYPAILKQITLVPKIVLLRPSGLRLVYQRCKSLIRQSKTMNNQIKASKSK